MTSVRESGNDAKIKNNGDLGGEMHLGTEESHEIQIKCNLLVVYLKTVTVPEVMLRWLIMNVEGSGRDQL